jgi:hypothetical protein
MEVLSLRDEQPTGPRRRESNGEAALAKGSDTPWDDPVRFESPAMLAGSDSGFGAPGEAWVRRTSCRGQD